MDLIKVPFPLFAPNCTLVQIPETDTLPTSSGRFETCRCLCLTSVTLAKCGIRSTLCWKVGNISGSTELFAL